jgi:putative transcriptional regulator
MSDSILNVVHESVKGLFKSGIVDQVTMRKFDDLCLPEIKEYTPEEIKKIRLRNKTSQSIFAHYLNISSSTIKQWERGIKKPTGSALKLLNIVDKKGLEILV